MNKIVDGAIQRSRESNPRNLIMGAGAAAAAVGTFMVGMYFVPKAGDIILDTIDNNEGWITLGAFGAGAALYAASDHERFVGVKGYGHEFRTDTLKVFGGVALALGLAAGADKLFISENPPATVEYTVATADVTESSQVAIDGNCEILVDFNEVSQAEKDSGRYELDAMRLQAWLYENEYFGDGVEPEVAIDGHLGEMTGTAVDSMQAAVGIPVEQLWDSETCAKIIDFTDGDPNTPSFNIRPELRFPGYGG